MKKEKTVSYQKHWDDDGTCFSQTVNITSQTLAGFIDAIACELIIPKGNYSKLYLKSPITTLDNIVFFNLTQRDFFNRFLKLPLKDRNTCFCIID